MLAVCSDMIDWVATGSMLQGIGTLAGVGAVIWGALIGAKAWREQKRAERRLEMAERILTATHKGRSALAYVRGVMMWGHELTAAEEKLKEDEAWTRQTDGLKKRLITAQAFYNRLNRTVDERSALDDCLPMARALFSEELEKAVETLRRQFWIVQVDVDSYIDDENGTDAEFTKKIRRGMYDIKPGEGERNEVSEAVAEVVGTIERICEPALRLEPIERRIVRKST
jgi:hypothetical protein